MKKQFLALCMAFMVFLPFGIPAHAAGSAYSVQVNGNTINFIRGGQVTGTYRAKSADLTLLTDSAGDLLVCFTDSKGEYLGVNLAKQTSLSLQGKMSTLTLSTNLSSDITVSLGSSGSASSMVIKSDSPVNIYGSVGTLSVSGEANIVARKACNISKARITEADARLKVETGANVKGIDSKKGTINESSSNKNIKFKNKTIYGDYDDTLDDLEDELEDNARAYVNNKLIPGDVEFSSNGSTRVRRNGNYRFVFTPDNSSYGKATGTIRIRVDDDDDYDDDDYYDDDYGDDDVYLDIEDIEVSSDNKRLSDLKSKLKSHVTAYDDDDDEINGSFRWDKSSSTRVRETGWYKFTFTPNSSRYERVRDEIKIIVDGDEDADDDDDDDELDVDIGEIEVSSDNKRLRDLRSKLKSNVDVRNSDGKRVSGTFKWEDDDDERVRETGDYKFRFIPDSSRYERFSDYITIYVDD